METLSTLHTRLHAGCRKLCVLLPRRDGLREELASMKDYFSHRPCGDAELEELRRRTGVSPPDPFHVICSAAIHDELFRQVCNEPHWSRMEGSSRARVGGRGRGMEV